MMTDPAPPDTPPHYACTIRDGKVYYMVKTGPEDWNWAFESAYLMPPQRHYEGEPLDWPDGQQQQQWWDGVKQIAAAMQENTMSDTSAPAALSTQGRSPDNPLPTLEWPGDAGPEPASWWGRNAQGQRAKIYRSYGDYCDD